MATHKSKDLSINSFQSHSPLKSQKNSISALFPVNKVHVIGLLNSNYWLSIAVFCWVPVMWFSLHLCGRDMFVAR